MTKSNDTHRKTIHGHVVITARVPIVFSVNAKNETYLDEANKEIVEEEYEYSVDDALANQVMLNRNIRHLKMHGWTVEDIKIEEI